VESVESVAFSPDGRLALSCGRGRTVRLWDVEARKELWHTRLPGQANAAAFTPDGSRFLVACLNQTVRIWDTTARQEVYRFATFGGVNDLAFLAGGRRLLVSGQAGALVWQLPGPDHPEGQLAFEGDPSIGFSLRLNRDGQLVQHVYVNGSLVLDLKPGEYQIEANSAPPLRSMLLLSAERVTIKAGRLQTVSLRRMPARLVTPDPGRVARADGALLMLLAREANPAADRGQLRADLIEFIRDNRGLPPALQAVAVLARLPSPLDRLDPDKVPEEVRKRIGGGDAADAPAGLVAVLGDAPARGLPFMAEKPGDCCVAFSPDGKWLAWAGADGRIRLCDPAAAGQVRVLEGHKGAVASLAFSPDGKVLASAGADGKAILWHPVPGPVTGRKVRELNDHKGAVRAVAFSPDSRALVTGGADGNVRLWRVADGAMLRALAAGPAAVTDLAWSPDGSLGASGGADGQIRLWDVAGTVRRSWHGSGRQGHGLAFSPDGDLLASTGWGNGVSLWESASGMQLRSLFFGRAEQIRCLAFRADGREVAAATADGVIRLGDPATGAETGAVRLRSAVNAITELAYSPDGRYLAVAHNGGLVSILRLAPAPGKKP
jgi:WD40 repeat protein